MKFSFSIPRPKGPDKAKKAAQNLVGLRVPITGDRFLDADHVRFVSAQVAGDAIVVVAETRRP